MSWIRWSTFWGANIQIEICNSIFYAAWRVFSLLSSDRYGREKDASVNLQSDRWHTSLR